MLDCFVNAQGHSTSALLPDSPNQNGDGSGVPLASFDAIHVLPPHAGALDMFTECVEIDELRVYVVGLSVVLANGSLVTGAAASLVAPPRERSYFELLERLALSGEGVELDAAGVARSKSNGVALNDGFERAARRAQLELIERDRVLRSWYGGARPRILRGVRAWPGSLERHYDLEVCCFEEGIDREEGGVQVVGIIAFPRDPSVPLSMGFGARDSLEEALDAAVAELLQQIAFGWGEPVPSVPPQAVPSPEFHLDFYAYPPHSELLAAWLAGAHEGMGPALPRAAGEFRFIDITPTWMGRGLRVVRATHPAAIPLVFGLGHPWFPDLPECMRVQPIA
jgi:hypothetical protein